MWLNVVWPCPPVKLGEECVSPLILLIHRSTVEYLCATDAEHHLCHYSLTGIKTANVIHTDPS